MAKGMDKVLILDFGAQYNQLIARRVREAKVYCEIVPYDISIAEIKKIAPEGLILSGGPLCPNFFLHTLFATAINSMGSTLTMP